MDESTTLDQRPGISTPQANAIVLHAQRQAILTDVALRARGIKPEGIPLPRAFLLELGAVLELAYWEKEGLRSHLDVDLPSYAEAANDLAQRVKKGGAEFLGPDAAPLAPRVLKVWIRHFAWEGLGTLHADVVAGEIDEDNFAELLADFLWTHRRELSEILPSEVEST